MLIKSAFVVAFASLSAASVSAESGAALFAERCATCHGVDGQGDGPMTPMLSVEVPDITVLTAQNGGEFPLVRVIETVEGTRSLGGHGGPMPVFGDLVAGKSVAVVAPDGTEIQTRESLLELARHLESLQR